MKGEKQIKITVNLIGKKFGKLTVNELIEYTGGCDVLVCICDCGQTVLVYGEEINQKQACQKCSFRAQRKFEPEEICKFVTQFSRVPFGTELIVVRQISDGNNPLYLCEHRGKRVECLASDLEATGKEF